MLQESGQSFPLKPTASFSRLGFNDNDSERTIVGIIKNILAVHATEAVAGRLFKITSAVSVGLWYICSFAK